MKSNITFLDKKLSIILGDKKHSPSECKAFTTHEENFRPTLDLILEKANKKIAVLHSKINVGTDSFEEKKILSAWQEERNVSISENPFFSNPPVTRMDHLSAYTRFNNLKEKFSAQPDLSQIRREIQENSGVIHESLLISKNLWGRINTHDFYDEMVSRFATLFINLNLTDLQFLASYVQWDEHGVLFLLWKYIHCKLGYILSSQLIIAIYKPGSFIEFCNKAFKVASDLVGSAYTSSNLLLSKNIRKVTFIGLASASLSLALFSNYFTKNQKTSVFSMYSGFSGNPGAALDLTRNVGGKIVFELAKTLSVLSNAALIGFLEPKQNLLKHLFKRD